MKKVLFAIVFAVSLCSASIYAEEKEGVEKKDPNLVKDEKVAIADLPKVVVDAVNTARPGGKITEADKETMKDGSVVYEVDVTQGGKKYEVNVDSTGKVISNKEETDEEEKKTEVKK